MTESFKTRLQMLGLKALGAFVGFWAVTRLFDATPIALRALITIAIPFLTGLGAWRLSVVRALPKPDDSETQERFKIVDRPLPWWGWLIIVVLNVWALRIIVRGAEIATSDHPFISIIGLAIIAGGIFYLVLDRPQVHSSLAWQRAYNIWGASASRRLGSPDKREKSESFNDRLTRERMEILTAEHRERLERERIEAEDAARRAREYDAKFGNSEGN